MKADVLNSISSGVRESCNKLIFILFIFRMIRHRCKTRFLFLLWLCVTLSSGSSLSWQPCPELSSALRFPCRCKVEPFGPKSQLGAVSMDCDNVVFHTESPILPNGAPIISFSQRYCGQQILPTQVGKSGKKCLRNGRHFNIFFTFNCFSIGFKSLSVQIQ